ncbi:MAG: HAD family hydrolase [Candidatus Hermodarchaeota archaeon]
MLKSRIIKAVLFDVDGVVVKSELLHLQTFNELLKSFNIHVNEEEWTRRFLGAGSAAIMQTLFEENGITDDPTPWVIRRRKLYQTRVALGDLQPVHGFLSFYQSVQNANLPTAFVSTGHPENLSAALESLGLKGKHPVIDGTQVARLKPDPAAYLVASQTVAVPPAHCLVFEDSPIGVSAAKTAGMACVALTTTNPSEDLSEADLIIPNFEGWTLRKIVTKLHYQLGE